MIKQEIIKDGRTKSNPILSLREGLGTQDAGSEQDAYLRVTGQMWSKVIPGEWAGSSLPKVCPVLG